MERNNFNVNFLKKIKKQSNEKISILEIGTVFFEHLKRYLNPNSSYISFESNDEKFLEFSEKFEGVQITDKKEDLSNKSFDYIVMNFDLNNNLEDIEKAINLIKELNYKELNIFLVSRNNDIKTFLEIAQKNNFNFEYEEKYNYFNIFISHTKTKEVREEIKKPEELEVEISIEKTINEV